MSSKEDILASIRKNTKNRYEYPDWQINATVYPDVVAKFCEMSFAVGGEAIVLGEGEDINAVIRRTYPDAGSIASDLEEITCATFNPDLLGRAQDLNGTDIAVVKGEIGVAENAAVWIPQTVKYKALYFIAEKLVIVLDKKSYCEQYASGLRTDKKMKNINSVHLSRDPQRLPTLNRHW